MPESPLNGTNPLNVDSPSSAEGFVEQFNREALQFIEEASGYEVMLQEVMAANQLGEQLVNLVRPAMNFLTKKKLFPPKMYPHMQNL